jgi:hypothetical protein
MKTAWIWFWGALGAAEVGLFFWSRSVTFLEIGAFVPVMIAYNLLRDRIGPRAADQAPASRPTPLPTPARTAWGSARMRQPLASRSSRFLADCLAAARFAAGRLAPGNLTLR